MACYKQALWFGNKTLHRSGIRGIYQARKPFGANLLNKWTTRSVGMPENNLLIDTTK
jgi:hypothetical protein